MQAESVASFNMHSMSSFLKTAPAHARDALRRLFALESAAGVLLVAAAMVALIIANSPLGENYAQVLAHRVVFDPGVAALSFDNSVLIWINDALMALFFLLVGLELKREMLEGQLTQRGDLSLPLLCALGGMIVPMLIYFALNRGDAVAMRGVAIPAATDIAFALGILTLLGKRVPLALKLLLTAIAVLDDIGAIAIIAIFYTGTLSPAAAGVALVALISLAVLNRTGSTHLWPYLVVGAVLWAATAKSGVHPTFAGVALACMVPMRQPRLQAALHDQIVAVPPPASPLLRLEHRLHPWVAFGVLPLFAFANAGLSLSGIEWRALGAGVPLGVMLGLMLGKPLGIMLGVLVARCTTLAQLPLGVDLSLLAGMSVLCGIGFTMSLFINHLAFAVAAPALAVTAQLAVLIASLLSAIFGFAWLRWTLRGVVG